LDTPTGKTNISDLDWPSIIALEDVAKIESPALVRYTHSSFRFVKEIVWDHDDYLLLLSDLSNTGLYIDKRTLKKIGTASYLLVNPKHPGHEILFKLTVNEKKGLIVPEVIKKHESARDLRIIDKQK